MLGVSAWFLESCCECLNTIFIKNLKCNITNTLPLWKWCDGDSAECYIWHKGRKSTTVNYPTSWTGMFRSDEALLNTPLYPNKDECLAVFSWPYTTTGCPPWDIIHDAPYNRVISLTNCDRATREVPYLPDRLIPICVHIEIIACRQIARRDQRLPVGHLQARCRIHWTMVTEAAGWRLLISWRIIEWQQTWISGQLPLNDSSADQ